MFRRPSEAMDKAGVPFASPISMGALVVEVVRAA
jgi:hypothetical protein